VEVASAIASVDLVGLGATHSCEADGAPSFVEHAGVHGEGDLLHIDLPGNLGEAS